MDGGGTTRIGVEACNKEGSKEVVRFEEVDEGIEADREGKPEETGLTLSEEGIDEEFGNQREKVVVKRV